MSSKLKIYIDYPSEIWIDSDFVILGETGKPNVVTLNHGTYKVEFKEYGKVLSNKIINIEEDNYEYLEIIQLIQNAPNFKLCNNIYYNLGTSSLVYGDELGLWSEEGYAITKPSYYNIEQLGYGLMRDIYKTAYGVDDLYEVKNFSGKIGIISPTGEELLECKYSEIKNIYSSLPNTRLFIQMLLYIKYKRVGDLLTEYRKWFPSSLNLLKDVQSAINILPVFWFAVVKKFNTYGVIGLNNEIFVPFQYEDCVFIGPNDIFCNIYEQSPSSPEDQQITRQDAYPLCFKVKLNNKWGVYQWDPHGNSKLIVDIKYDDCDLAPNGLKVTIEDKAAIIDENGEFKTEFVDKSSWWVFAY